MNFLRKMFGPKHRDVQELIRELSFQSPDVAASQAAVDRFRQINPLVANMGIFLDVGGGIPPEVTNKIKERDNLEEQLAKARAKEEQSRAQAALKLGELGDPQAVDALIVALKGEYTLVRRNVAEALGRIGDQRAVASLLEVAQNDSDESVRTAAQQALETLQK